MSRLLRTTFLTGAVLAAATAALAVINPNFTPKHLVEQAELIAVLRLGKPDEAGTLRAEVVRVLKGGLAAKALTLAPCRAGEALATAGGQTALLFVGKGEQQEPLHLLHVSGAWLGLKPAGEDRWQPAGSEKAKMDPVWAGGTELFVKVVDLLVKHPDLGVPVVTDASWGREAKVAAAPGAVSEIRAVSLPGRSAPLVFAACEAGDMVLAWEAGARKLVDVTAKLGLGSRSRLSAWGDFDGDGRLDLASWDGKSLTLHLQGADGRFGPLAASGAPEIEGGPLGLVAVDAGAGKRAGLLWSSHGAPVLLVPAEGKPGGFVPRALEVAGGAAEKLGEPGPCLTADLDGDGLFDVLQPFEKGSLFFKGLGAGRFAAAKACAIAAGDGRVACFAGDWDADGLLDVFTVSSRGRCGLWQNLGADGFVDPMKSNVMGASLCGEMNYESKSGAVGGAACDFNNDGLQDVFIVYAGMDPQFFFNRGGRSFGMGWDLNLLHLKMLPAAHKGVQAAAMADFNGDGGQDMVMVLPDGAVWFLPQDLEAKNAEFGLAVRVRLPAGGAPAGPVTVSAADDRRPLGAWNVRPGVDEAFVCRTDPGEVTVTWKLPGGDAGEKNLTLEEKPLVFDLPSGDR